MMQDQQRGDLRAPPDRPGREPGGEANSDAQGKAPLPDGKGPEDEKGSARGNGGGKKDDPGLRSRRRRRTVLLACAAILLIGGIIGYGVYDHEQTQSAAQTALNERQTFVPSVRVEPVKVSNDPREIHLPATTQPIENATIYARQSGYIARREVDIGSRVKTGDLLAVIAAPELDDQLNQARAQLQQMQAALDQAMAQRDLALVTNNRTTPLVKQGWETQQTGDQNRLNLTAQNAAVEVARANITAQQASISRLERLQSYERVVAPFDGVITQRNIDTGSLVTADLNSGTSIFAIARDNVLRVQVYVPQDVALFMHPGIEAALEVPELQGRSFKGTVTRTASALEPNTRTLLVEVDIDNPDGTLTAGLYGTMRFSVPRPKPIVIVPSNAIIFNQNGVQVATYANGVAHLQKIEIGEDDGATLQVAGGLNPDSTIIVGPPANITDNMRVDAMPPKKEAQTKKEAQK